MGSEHGAMVGTSAAESIMNGRTSKKPGRRTGSIAARSKVWLEVDGEFAVGEWGIALLEAVRSRGSLRQAATAVGWSYRHVWDYIQRMEAAFGVPLVVTAPDRPRAGAQLTAHSETLLRSLHALREAVRKETERAFRSTRLS